jgi:hypothetical protein
MSEVIHGTAMTWFYTPLTPTLSDLVEIEPISVRVYIDVTDARGGE